MDEILSILVDPRSQEDRSELTQHALSAHGNVGVDRALKEWAQCQIYDMFLTWAYVGKKIPRESTYQNPISLKKSEDERSPATWELS